MNRQKTFGADDSGSLVEHVVRCHEVRFGRTVVGLSGIEASGKSTIADELADGISTSGHDVVTIHGDEFSTAKAVRNNNPDAVRGYLEDAYDYSILSSRVLVPLRSAEVSDISYVSTDPETDESVVTKARVPDRAIVLVEGVLLFRGLMRDQFDLRIWVETSFDESLRRAKVRPRDVSYYGTAEAIVSRYESRFHPAQRIHLRDDRPQLTSHVIVRS
ncbi:uridine kinase [Rhodococcus erythropolis]|uniref:uridine kinase n=1 Tax=Rhodococcus baikonurensis TaxID=172041 RepID=UPI00260E1336|nr:uridine kinase [uncultured Rhodococcus sp.]